MFIYATVMISLMVLSVIGIAVWIIRDPMLSPFKRWADPALYEHDHPERGNCQCILHRKEL